MDTVPAASGWHLSDIQNKIPYLAIEVILVLIPIGAKREVSIAVEQPDSEKVWRRHDSW